jgi:chorismate dehydratase
MHLPIPSPSIAVPPSAPGQPRIAVAAARIGAVQYLNTRPLVHRLAAGDQLPNAPSLSLSYDVPSRLADRLAAGQLDVALIPVVEVFRGGGSIVSNACIACRGPVMSVKIFFRTRPDRVRRIALDEGSRTSAVLGRLLLAERFSVRPEIEHLPIHASLDDTDADAVLLIGDRALGPVRGGFQVVWDLGDEWCRWTGLPFVFAAWAARPGLGLRQGELLAIASRLEAARDSGVANLAAIAAAEAAGHGLTVPQCLGYLRDNLHYHLGQGEMAAIRRFRELAAAHGLVPGEGSSR